MALSFHGVGLKNQTQADRLESKFSPNHLSALSLFYIKDSVFPVKEPDHF